MKTTGRSGPTIALATAWVLAIMALGLVGCGNVSGESQSTTTAVSSQPSRLIPTVQPTETLLPTATKTATESSAAATSVPVETAPSATPEATPETPTPEAQETPAPTASQVTQVNLELVASGFNRPLYLTHAFDERLFVVEQTGRVKIINNGQTEAEPFLDIQNLVGSTALEQGLLSIAFHPHYPENGRFFVDYTDLNGDTVVAEYRVDPSNANRADLASERILLTVAQPYGNHNGGQLQFGPDGYLYVGMGDGGSAGDPQRNGQNLGTILGALLRLDVDGPDPSSTLAYGIPADNPFVGQSGARPEIWAYGLRNPWRFSFDQQTGDLYVADVGQNLWEEVDFQAAGAAGGANYGWNVMEGSHCYGSSACDGSGFSGPVAEYPHQEGNCSITGGYVYRGATFPALGGNYFFADYCSGALWSLFRSEDGQWQQLQLQRPGFFTSSFGEDWRGELYIIDHVNGDIYQLQS